MIEIRQATDLDTPYIVSLMRANRESVGGLPVPAVRERIQRGTLLLAVADGDPVGYLLYDLRAGVIRIPQACIQYDARRSQYGVALLQRMLGRHDVDEVRVRCAADLEANIFWRSMGFTCLGQERGGQRRGRTINLWSQWFAAKLVGIESLARVPASEVRQDSMYDDSGFLAATPDGFAAARQLPKLAWSNRPQKTEELTLW